jgi:hypothetical protein
MKNIFQREDTTLMDNFLKNIRDIADQLEDMHISLPEEITVLLILHSLPSVSYNMLVTSLTAFNLPSYDELEAKLINAEVTMVLTNEKSSEALFIGSRNQKGKGKLGQTTRSIRRSSSTSTIDGGSIFKSERRLANSDPRLRFGKARIATKEDKCNKCGERGHWAPQCDVIHMTRKMEKLENKIHNLTKKKKPKFQVKGKCLIRVFLSGLWKNVLFMLKSMREKSRNDIL